MAPFRKSTVARRSGLARVGVVAVAAAVGLQGVAFTGGALSAATGSRLALRAESEPAPAPAPVPAPAPAPKATGSTALVKVSEENITATAGVLGGLAGLWFGGLWLGAGLFALSSYVARKDDDISKALKGIAQGSLETLNFTSSMNEKYAVTDQVGSKLAEAIDKQKADGSSEAISTFSSVVDSAKGAIDSVDKDIGIKDTVGSLLMSAGDLASQAVEKAIELNEKYKLSDQIADKVQKATKEASSTAAPKKE